MNMENMDEGIIPLYMPKEKEKEEELGLESLEYLHVFHEPMDQKGVLDKLHAFPRYRLLTLHEIYALYGKHRDLFKGHKNYWVNEYSRPAMDGLCYFHAKSNHPVWYLPYENINQDKYLILVNRDAQIDTEGVEIAEIGL